MKTMEIIPSNSLNELDEIRSFARIACVILAQMDEKDDRIPMVELGVNEVAANIIKHANLGRKDVSFRIAAQAGTGKLDFEFFDNGKGFDPAAVTPPHFDGSRENGFGIYIVSEVFDKVVYRQNEAGENHSILTLLL